MGTGHIYVSNFGNRPNPVDKCGLCPFIVRLFKDLIAGDALANVDLPEG
jgi:hypothetical protein